MKTIGFANKFYTLWDVRSEIQYITDGYGKHHESGVKYYYDYIKNISFELDKVKELYPEAPINEDLRGLSRSFTTESNKENGFPSEFFRNGKFRGLLLSECQEGDYLYWFLRNYASEDQKELVIELLVSKFKYFVFEGDVYKTQEEIDSVKKSIKQYEEVKKLLEEAEGKEIEINFLFEKNLNSEGRYSKGHYCFEFPDFKEMYYAGIYYGLPTINGVGKKIKNKELKLTITSKFCEGISQKVFKVLKFEVLKK